MYLKVIFFLLSLHLIARTLKPLQETIIVHYTVTKISSTDEMSRHMLTLLLNQPTVFFFPLCKSKSGCGDYEA